MEFQGKTILVTGGGSGIGLASAQAFHNLGAKVAICGRNKTKLDKASELISKSKERVLSLVCDAGQPKEVENTISSTIKTFGPIDILVHCVGMNVKERSFQELNPESWRSLVEGNLDSAYYVFHEVLKGMRPRKNGLVIVVNSISGLRGNPLGGPGYVAGKFGLNGLVVATAAEESKNNIRFCSIFPGEVNTPILEARPNPVSEEHKKSILQPEDVAQSVLFVARLPEHVVIPELIIIPSKATYI
jgi:NADP-dependent 3-hydroxy acid dehydrogenase YdfG